MEEITFIIGLPGSGKSTLLEYYQNHPNINYKVYDDWLECTLDSFKDKTFDSECRYKEVINDIKNNKRVLISGLGFCDIKFLNASEYLLKIQFPNLNIKRIYFSNSPEICKNNVKIRDEIRGGYWDDPDENGKIMYYGTIFNDIPLYKLEQEKIDKLTTTYIIPNAYSPLKVVKAKE